VLGGSASATAIFDRLQEPAEQARFFNGLKDMKAVRFVASPDEFRAFLQRWPDLKAFIQQVRAGQQQAVQHVQERLDRRAMLQALEDANGEFGRAIREAGFELADTEALSLVDQARLVSDTKAVEDTINQTVIRQAIAARRDVLPGDVTIDMIWKMLRDRDTAEWYIGTMRAAGVEPGRIDAARLTAMAQARARARLLVKTEMLTVDAGGGFMGVGRRMTWLAFVSMLVCVVGIANAMLMSVTERFREIATLKCLGALDGFIMTVFLIEACVMGLVGGVIGTLIGLVLGVARMWAAFQSLLAQAFPTGLLLGAALISIGLGIMLAAVAAVYPSLRAARLAPMEAMRIE